MELPPQSRTRRNSVIERLQAKRNEEGFTLIELLIVIIVLGILAAIVVFAVAGTKKDAVASTCKTDVKSIELSAESVVAKKPGATALTSVDPGDLIDSTKGGLLKEMPSSTNYKMSWVKATGTVKVTKTDDTGGGTGTAGCDLLG
jgi:prepilin-type N-terminal cleavage/methylation domain-containing protein